MKESKQRSIFKEWLGDYRALLFKVIRAYAFNVEDQNDLFQEVCLQVWRSIPNFRGASAVSTWLYRIALNTAIKWTTKEQKHVDGRADSASVQDVLFVRDEPQDERLSWLYDEIKQFNEIDRSLTLLLLDGFSYKEIAKIVGVSESHVGVKIHRIKKQLVKKSEKYDRHGI